MQQQQQQQTQQQQQQQLHEKHQLGQGADEQKDQFSSGPRHGQQQRLCKDVQELLDASYHQKNMQELQHGQEGQKQLVGLPFHGGQGQKEKHGSSTEPALSLESDNIKQPDDEHLPEQEHSGEARIALLRSAAERALPPEVAQRRPADQRCTAARLLSPEPLPNTTTTPTTTTARIKTTTPPTLRMRKRRTREAAAAQCMQSYLQAGEAAAAAAAAVPSQAVALQKLQKDNITAAIVEALEVRPWTPCLEDQAGAIPDEQPADAAEEPFGTSSAVDVAVQTDIVSHAALDSIWVSEWGEKFHRTPECRGDEDLSYDEFMSLVEGDQGDGFQGQAEAPLGHSDQGDRTQEVDIAMAAFKQSVERRHGSMREAFRAMDKTRNSALSPTEFATGLSLHGIQLAPNELQDMWERFDPNQDGLITYASFCRTMAQRAEHRNLARTLALRPQI
ncbi:unnamed protein product [Polarella glacialis]|uniref:EF-hand domain-containing protein n=1 Tax=Polarella glacialis TaxID=89957 RepID=A0A813JZG0_POLGL|nr:unnamed protein product [Polarella glacialis]